MLSGCNNPGTTESEVEIIEENCIIKEDTSIDFLCMADSEYHDALQAMVNNFEKSEPHVKVRLYNPLGSGNYAAIEKIIVSGFFKEDYPDLAQCYPDNVFKYISQGYAVNIDKYLNNRDYGILGEEKEDYISSFLKEGQSYSTEGTYSLPFCKSTELMYYNADVLVGLNLSTIDNTINDGKALDKEYLDNITWEELFDKLCPAIYAYNESMDSDHKIYVNSSDSAIFTYDSDENFFITLAYQYDYGYTHLNANGKGSVDFNNENMKNLLKKLKYAKDNKYLQTRGSYEDYVSSLFTSRKALFTVSSTAGLTYNYNSKDPFTVGVAKIPHSEGKSYSSINQGPSVCILDHKDENRSLASYLLWKHITNKTNSSSWALATGYMGIRNSSYQTEQYKAAVNIPSDNTDLYKLAVSNNLTKISEVRDSTFNTAVFRGSSNARTLAGLLMKECLKSNDIENDINSLFQKHYDDAVNYIE